MLQKQSLHHKAEKYVQIDTSQEENIKGWKKRVDELLY